jgi:peptidoglycan/xylan/chitin deacetylase (PgdA/CDA1 family)
MQQARPLAQRIITKVASLAVAATVSTVVVAGGGMPAQAATCSGYVALTFDDGPNPSNTTTLLATLKSAGLRATMFNVGENAANNPSLVRAQATAGMWIANHSWSHPHMATMSTLGMAAEISRTQWTIRQLTGTAPRLFRPPYGETNAKLRAVQAAFGLKEILWDVDSQDWNGASTESIVAASSGLTAGQIVLMHDGPPNTVAAIPQIAAGLRSRNLCTGMISPTTGRAVAPSSR